MTDVVTMEHAFFMEELVTIGNRLKQIRKFLHLTQNEVAHSVHVSQAAISRIEHGEEVYASVFLALINYYRSQRISIETFFKPHIDISQEVKKEESVDQYKSTLLFKIANIRDELTELYTDIHSSQLKK